MRWGLRSADWRYQGDSENHRVGGESLRYDNRELLGANAGFGVPGLYERAALYGPRFLLRVSSCGSSAVFLLCAAHSAALLGSEEMADFGATARDTLAALSRIRGGVCLPGIDHSLELISHLCSRPAALSPANLGTLG